MRPKFRDLELFRQVRATPATVSCAAWFGAWGYLTTRPATAGRVEFGAHAFGPHARAVAEAMAEQVRGWDRDQRGGPGPTFAVWPMGTPDDCLPGGLVIDKRYNHVTISWPAAAFAATSHDFALQQHPGLSAVAQAVDGW